MAANSSNIDNIPVGAKGSSNSDFAQTNQSQDQGKLDKDFNRYLL